MNVVANAPPNHTIDPATGFVESLAFSDAFDATKKLSFIQTLRANDFRFERTCKESGISPHTIYKHRRIDKAFDEAIQHAIKEYGEHLEWVSRSQALEPKATLERIFQLRAIFPGRYARELKTDDRKIEINISGDLITSHRKEREAIEATIVRELDDTPEEKYQISTQVSDVSTEIDSLSKEDKGQP